MKKIPNLPTVHLMPFSEIDEKRPVLLVTSTPAWNAVKENLHGLNNIPQDMVDRTLKNLPAYCERHNLSFGIAHTLQSNLKGKI